MRALIFKYFTENKVKRLAENLLDITNDQSYREFLKFEEYKDIQGINTLNQLIFEQDLILTSDLLDTISLLTKKLPVVVQSSKRLGRYIALKGNTKNTLYYNKIFDVMSSNPNYIGKRLNDTGKQEIEKWLLNDMVCEEGDIDFRTISEYGLAVFNTTLFEDDLINETSQLIKIKQDIWNKYQLDL